MSSSSDEEELISTISRGGIADLALLPFFRLALPLDLPAAALFVFVFDFFVLVVACKEDNVCFRFGSLMGKLISARGLGEESRLGPFGPRHI